ncbi:MAG: glycosyltransferase [Rhodobacteraceae bacterium]|nr:MAG: glycosyltransferase [Paracoccaceae bacterium]
MDGIKTDARPTGSGPLFPVSGQIISISVRDWAQLRSEILHAWGEGRGFALATLNLDHLQQMRCDPVFAAAYARHDMVVADGRPIVSLARLSGQAVGLMPGSDLVVPLAQLAAERRQRVALVGSTPQALAAAARVLMAHAPELEIALVCAPSQGFDPDGDEAARILADLRERRIGLAFLALGAPRQERLAARGRELAPGVGFASIGAGLDFLGGHQRRAPVLMRSLALEWLWRAALNPRRLVPRYLRCAAILPGQIMAAWQRRA